MARLMIWMVLLGALVAGVAMLGGASAEPPETAISDVERALPSDEGLADLEILAADNTAFAIDFYHQLRGGADNVFFSPLSLSMALGMASAGAREGTLAQMEAALRFTLDQERLHPAFNAIDWLLESRQHLPEGWGEGFTLNLVNSLWGQTGYPFHQSFLDLLAVHYGAGVRLTDFVASPEAARLTINAWVEETTNDRIQDLIGRGAITEDTLLTLVNAIYFSAPWAFPFREEDTAPGPFILLDDTEIETPLMHETEVLGYVKGEDYTAVELDYNGNQLSMVIILPDEGAFAEVEGRFSSAFLGALLEDLSREHVILTLPKFEMEWGGRIDDYLQALGMADAFDGRVADFSGIDGTRDFFIGAVIHKAFVAVDESGTEAAAATAIVMEGAAMTQPTYYQVRVDRPFLFFIREKETDSILFLGRVLDPR